MFAAWWFFNGPEIISRDRRTTANTVCDSYIQQHPLLADFIADQRNRFGEFNTAVAIESLEGRTLNPAARRRSIDVRARLTSLYSKDPAGDESILWSHGTAIDALRELPDATEDYLTQLEAAKQDSGYWSLVRDDPVALTSRLLRNDKDLRGDYRENRDWYLEMMEVLMAMLEVKVDPDSSESGFIELDDLLRVASDVKPHLMQLVPKPGETPIEASIYFETFRQFGEAIVMAAAEGVSPKEAAEVIVLNRDALVTGEDEINGEKIADPAGIAARLIELYRKRPDVWKAAQRDGYVLSFDKLTPGLSQSVLEKHPDLGAASLIVTQYPDLATQAASIVNEYGDLGMAVLVQYDGSEKFRELLRSADVDHRIAMVAVLKSDVGLESALENPAYIDKWIGKDGKPLEDEWWTNVPLIGGVGKVAVNYATGVPSDWSEIGWAAWDVADVGLMVVSLGSSKIVTESAKQTAKQTAKRVGKSAAQKLTETGLKRGAVAATKPTAMARLIAVARASSSTKPIRWTARTTIQLARVSQTVGSKLVAASGQIIRTAKSIPPGVRRWAARGLLGASLFVRGPERIRALISSMNEYGKQMIADTIDAIPAAISKAMNRLKDEMGNLARGNFATLIYMIVLLGAGLLAAMLLLGLRPRIAFANSNMSAKANGRRKSTSTRKKK
ncbi:hypothetical protein CKO51_27150 [Rhodopirellula sp. SM50]|nr:hypothetical protein [Rhodopirellula sp. SM50]PAY16333.1 hypothetical protein CKO51_27150 [Rhodopirellula sp. SM50]